MSSTEETLESRGKRKVLTGRVISDAMDKTVVVEVRDATSHATYKKIVRRDKNLKAHDEDNSAGRGDLVRIMETRPLSKSKRWRVVEILEKAK